MEKRIASITKELSRLYGDPKPFLDFKTPFQLLVSVILSAQCTDARVNKVTPALFAAAGTPKKILALGTKKLISYIHSTGFYNAKAKHILGMCRMLIEKYHGELPRSLDELQKLPGVGRKSASVLLIQAFGLPAFPVDRHVFRVANRLALSHGKNPDQTDVQLRAAIPQKKWGPVHLQLIIHGRKICRPKPKCGECTLIKWCPEGQRILQK